MSVRQIVDWISLKKIFPKYVQVSLASHLALLVRVRHSAIMSNREAKDCATLAIRVDKSNGQ